MKTEIDYNKITKIDIPTDLVEEFEDFLSVGLGALDSLHATDKSNFTEKEKALITWIETGDYLWSVKNENQ